MTFAESVPWFFPGVLVSIAIGLGVRSRVAAALAMSRTDAFATLVSLGVIISATLLPLRAVIVSGATGSGTCDLSRVGLASVTELMTASVHDTLLNILLFVPLGLAIGVATRSPYKALLVLAAIALPIAIEGTQLFVPSLGRSCETADVFDNLTGLGLGLLAGSIVARARS